MDESRIQAIAQQIADDLISDFAVDADGVPQDIERLRLAVAAILANVNEVVPPEGGFCACVACHLLGGSGDARTVFGGYAVCMKHVQLVAQHGGNWNYIAKAIQKAGDRKIRREERS